MKSRMALFLVVICALLGSALALQIRQNRVQRARLEQIQLQLEDLLQQTRQAVDASATSEKERADLQKELAATQDALARAQNSAPQVSATPRGTAPNFASPATSQPAAQQSKGAEPGGMGKMLGEMLKNPEMRKAMEQQQRLALNMMYDPLIKQLQLTPDQEKKFKDLLMEQQMNNISTASGMFEPGVDRAEAAQKAAAQQKERDAQMKELLGDDKFAQMQQYNQTVGERVMLEQFGKDAEMTPDQKEQLLALLGEEKKNVQINRGMTTNPNKDFQAVLGSPEATEKLLAQQQEANERVLERASRFLTPEQIQKLDPVLKSQIEMQRAGLKMAQQMFGNSSGQGNSGTTPQNVPAVPAVSSPPQP